MNLAQTLLPIAVDALYRADRAAQATEMQRAVDALRREYHDLVTPAETRGGALVAAAKNLRTQLRRAFPGHKFSVRTERFSMGDALRVIWTDGPAVSRVEAVADQYQGGSYNGQEDIYEYCRSAWAEAFGDAKYVTTQRDYSPKIAEWLSAKDADVPERWEVQRLRHIAVYHLNIKAVKPAVDA